MAVPYSFFEVYLAVHPKDLPSGRPQVRDRHLSSSTKTGTTSRLDRLCVLADGRFHIARRVQLCNDNRAICVTVISITVSFQTNRYDGR
jgi:hypothetical protein